MPSTVSIIQVSDSVQQAVREALELVSWRTHLEKGKPTALKVNLGWDLFIPGSITSPWVVEGVIRTIREWVGPIFVVESDQVLERIEIAFRKSKLNEVCEREGVTWVNMSHSEMVKVPVESAAIFDHLELPKILLDTQLVTIPVMKTHAKTGISGSLKNQWGCISKLRHNYHLVLSNALADINQAVRPALALMDATIALEGNGPKSGKPKIVNRILASADPVALDTVQATVMGLDPGGVEHLQVCASRGLGENRIDHIDLLGEQDARNLNFGFTPATHNLVSRLEEILRRSRWKWVFFDTPLFILMLIGAKFWYLVWFYVVSGKKHWRTVLSHPFYGILWKTIREE
jgi:uncharacterized protein (DUF362 family)